MSIQELTSEEITALVGTRHPVVGFEYPVNGLQPYYEWLMRTLDLSSYDDATALIWLDTVEDHATVRAGVSNSGWPPYPHIKLAEVTLASGAITAILDRRSESMLSDVGGGNLTGTDAAVFVVDRKSLAAKIALDSNSAAGSFTLSLSPADLSQNRRWIFPDAGDTVVGLVVSQTLENKTLITPTIASFANAGHTHTDAAGGGQLTDDALAAPVGVAKGGTGADSVDDARANLGLGTAAELNAGTGSGDVPVLDSDGKVARAALPVFVGSGVGHASGTVPDPGATAGTANFLCESGGWANPLAVASGGSIIFADGSTITATTISDTSGAASLDFSGRTGKDAAGVVAMSWADRLLKDASALTSVDWAGRLLLDASGQTVLAWTDGAIGVFGATPVGAQGAGDVIVNLTDSSGGTSGGDTIAQIHFAASLSSAANFVDTQNAVATLAARVNELVTQVNTLRAALVAFGWIA